jgi:hypothetical protein
VREVAPEQHGRNEIRDDVPGRPRGLGAVERVFVGDALADPADAFTLDPDQHERPVVDPAEARLEEPHQRKSQEPQLDPLDSHGTML